MKLFSQRKSLKTIRSIIQVDSMDAALRNHLWNVLTFAYWSKGAECFQKNSKLEALCHAFWHRYFEKTIDCMPNYWPVILAELKNEFFTCKWNEVYDFIEFVATFYPEESCGEVNKEFINICNIVLKDDLSAYRFIEGKIVQISSEEEINEIEKALDIPTPLKPVKEHLTKALNLLADRKKPDYGNSIKESILAVEAICRLITKNPKATLGQALKEIGKTNTIEIHPALKNAFGNLYGYTSDADGIRHALLEKADLDIEDATFMLVSVSAFINYLRSKLSKADIKIG